MVTTGRAANQIHGFFGELDVLGALFFVADLVGGGAKFARELLGEFHVEGLIDGGEDLLFDELFDDEIRFNAELFGKLLDGDPLRNGDFAIDGRRLERHGALGNALAKDSFFEILTLAGRLPGAGLGLMAALLLSDQRRGGFGAQWSCRVHRPQTRGDAAVRAELAIREHRAAA